MIISRITIRDFQSIAHADIELAQWTSLVGESDVGKSAVVRALHAALTNARGDLFIRRGADACVVRIDLSDGRIVEWQKTRGRSGDYTIVDGAYPQQVFEKTGGEVPPEVAALLRVAVPVAGEALLPGLQGQHDPPFLFAYTPRRRAQILGEFDGTNILLAADGALRKDLRAEQGRATQRREDAQTAEAALQQLDWVAGAATLLGAADAAHSALQAGEARAAALRDAHTLVGAARSKLGIATVALAATPVAPVVDFDAIERGAAAHVLRMNVRAAAEMARRKVERAQAAAPPDLVPLAERIAHLDAMHVAQRAARAETANHATAQVELATATGALNRSAQELHNLVGTACPECGQPLTAEALEVG